MEYTRSVVKTNFDIGEDGLFNCTIDDVYGTESIHIYPNDNNTCMAYAYENKDEIHTMKFQAIVDNESKIENFLFTDKFITKKAFTFENVKLEDIKYHSNSLNQSDMRSTIAITSKLMLELNPNYLDIIKKAGASLESNYPYFYWFDHLLSLSFPDYTIEEIKQLFGLEPKKVIFDDGSFSLTEVFDEEKEKTLARTKKVEK